jgi:hypothetical protein
MKVQRSSIHNNRLQTRLSGAASLEGDPKKLAGCDTFSSAAARTVIRRQGLPEDD